MVLMYKGFKPVHAAQNVIDLPLSVCSIGMHQNQLYVQPSDQMQETVSAAAANSLQTVPLRITWRPYLSTGNRIASCYALSEFHILK